MISGSEVLAPLLEELGADLGALSRLAAHAKSVHRDGERLALVSAGDIKHILRRHTADSLLFALARRPLPGERWVDVGSGGGFPGLVLGSIFGKTSFTLLEPNKRKAGFLEMEVLELGLGNVQVLAERSERVDERFDVAVARALADPAEALEITFSLVRDGGEAIVAGTGSVRGARVVSLERPGVDSPGTLFMMTRGPE